MIENTCLKLSKQREEIHSVICTENHPVGTPGIHTLDLGLTNFSCIVTKKSVTSVAHVNRVKENEALSS